MRSEISSRAGEVFHADALAAPPDDVARRLRRGQLRFRTAA